MDPGRGKSLIRPFLPPPRSPLAVADSPF